MAEGLIIGIVLSVLFFAKPLNVFVKEMSDSNPGLYAYSVLGLIFIAASWLLGWIGFASILVTYVLYHTMSTGTPQWVIGLWQHVRSFRTRTARTSEPQGDSTCPVQPTT